MTLKGIFTDISLVSIIILIVATGCKKDQHDDLTKINHGPLMIALDYYNFFNDLESWSADKILEEDSVNVFSNNYSHSGGYYYYNLVKEDTSYRLAFKCFISSADTIFIPMELYKRYEDQYYQYILLFGENGDTLFYYKASLYGELHKIFIKGKYYYQYLFGEMTLGQLEYFRQNKDSLIKIRGNNLVDLPEYKLQE